MDHVIIGNSAAGVNAAEVIRQHDRKSSITIISDEPHHVYSRCLTSYFLAGDISRGDLFYRPMDFYKKNEIEALLGRRVVELKIDKNKIILQDGEKISYDNLLLAIGGSPKFPEIPGIDKEGVFGLRSVDDALNIMERARNSQDAVIIGGGLVSLKAAYGLYKQGLNVTIVISSGRVLSQMLDQDAANIIRRRLESLDFQIKTGQTVQEIVGNGGVTGVKLKNNEVLESDIIIVGKGVSPNLDLVKSTNIKYDYGVLVDSSQRTNIGNVYAAGDVAQAVDLIYGDNRCHALWTNAVEQGKIAGYNMAGIEKKYFGGMSMNSVEFFGVPSISVGVTRPSGEEYEILTKYFKNRNIYRKLVLKDNVIVGMIYVGDVGNAGVVSNLIKNKINVQNLKKSILETDFSYPFLLEDGAVGEGDKVFKNMEVPDPIKFRKGYM